MNKKLITSALPYVNNAPHLGNIIGCVLSADVFARFCRLRGYETLYVCGTDGYGTATENKARAEGLSPKEICEKYHVIHERVYKFFNISFDAFGKTFTETHSEVVQEIYSQLDKNQALIEKESDQFYCKPCDTFLADRLIEGDCPSCNSDQARGDQCDSCGKILDPIDLINPKCSVCKNVPEIRRTKHLYLDLPKLEAPLVKWHEQVTARGNWTFNAINVTKSWVKQGLNPRPITRDLKWGVPVPRPGYEDKVFYVWFDAPIGYISITKHFFPTNWQNWWLNANDVELHQFLGKDNIPFHSIIFPACLIGTNEPWTLVKQLSVTEFLNYENQKFSKSKNIGIFGSDVMDLGFPSDYWRYYLLSIRPEKQDANFSWEEFFDKINNDLNDNLGNLFNRVLVFHSKNFSPIIKRYDYGHPALKAFIDEISLCTDEITEQLERAELRDAIRNILKIGNLANKFFHEQELWKKIKTDPTYVEEALTLLINVIRTIGVVSSPIIPDSALKLLTSLGQNGLQSWSSLKDYNALTGVKLNSPIQLFHKLDTVQINSLRARFGGELDDFKKLDIRVGQIENAFEHATQENLFVIELNTGTKKITTVSSLGKHYQTNELINKKVLYVHNLEPALIHDTQSEGIILTAHSGKKLEVLSNNNWAIGNEATIDIVKKTKTTDLISYNFFKDIGLQVSNKTLTFKGFLLQVEGKNVETSEVVKGKIK